MVPRGKRQRLRRAPHLRSPAVIKYLGSKRLLVPAIGAAVRALPVRSAVDLFAGTTRVGQELRRAGVHVLSNDTAAYSEAFGWAYIAATPDDHRQLPAVLAKL